MPAPATSAGLRPRPLALRRKGGGGDDDDGPANSPPSRRAPLVGLLALPWALYAYSTVSGLNSFTGGVSPNGRGRPRSRSLAVYQSCSLSVLSKPDRPVVPVYGASYPGSGSATLHYLAEGLTGLEAGEDAKDKADSYDKVMIRTHYPAWKRQVGGDARLMDRSILLVRNPLDALPGHASLYYEKKSGIRIDGETPATEEFWLEWRESHFDDEIVKWSDQVSHWASKEPRAKRLVLSYENLVDEKRGPVEAGRVAAFLARGSGVEAVPNERVPCVWDKVVRYGAEQRRRRAAVSANDKKEEKNDKKEEESLRKEAPRAAKDTKDPVAEFTKTRSLRETSLDAPRYEYTEEQLRTVLLTLEELKEKFPEEYTLVVALEEYKKDCQRRLRKFEKVSKGTKKDGSD